MSKAIRINKFGGPDVLLWEDNTLPKLNKDEVLVKQTSIGLNLIDTYHRSGLYPVPLPNIIGTEGAGIVEEIGPEVLELKKGDRVAYTMSLGAYAEYRNISEKILVKLPEYISNDDAAAIMLKGCTAQYLLKQAYNVKKGDTVLIHAAAGGVGLIACQWAKHLGATVIGTVSTEEKASMVSQYGCDFPIIYTKENFVDKVLDITKGKKLPVVYDSVGKLTFLNSLKCLDRRGLMVSYGNASGPPDSLDILELMKHGSLFLTRPTLADYTANRTELINTSNDLFNVINLGAVKVEINQTYSLNEIGNAHKDIEERKTTGSTVLKTNL
jgi:NADPH2:quinone reductase